MLKITVWCSRSKAEKVEVTKEAIKYLDILSEEKAVVNVAGAWKLALEVTTQHVGVDKIEIATNQQVLIPILDSCEVKIIAASSYIVLGLHIVIIEAITTSLLIKG